MPNKPATPNRSVRLDDELWDRVRQRADDERVTMSEVVRRALRAYLR